MREIDCLIISTGRAASTAIYKYLGVVGELNLPWNKEPHFWCDIEKHGDLYDLLCEINIRDDAAYSQLYSNSELVVDASVGYFFYIEEVIRKLSEYGQKPKVIFLYREPVSRAESLFNELKKKDTANSANVSDDIKIKKEEGLWWESYYDNVDYFDAFVKMEDYFNEIIAINYDYFSKNQKKVISLLSSFLKVDAVQLDSLELVPINSSKDAVVISKFRFVREFVKFLPKPIKNYIKSIIGERLLKSQKLIQDDLTSYLSNSIAQYQAFRKHIEYKDILCTKK